MSLTWNIDIELLPGPKRDLPYMRDVEYVSPDGAHLALAYTVCEISMGWDVGVLNLFRGPSSTPAPLLSGSEVMVMPFGQKNPWLDERFFAITSYMWNKKDRVELPFLIVDVEKQMLAYYPIMNSYICSLRLHKDGFVIIERERDARFASHGGEIIRKANLQWFSFEKFVSASDVYWSGQLGCAT
jgi:hypothetical protein